MSTLDVFVQEIVRLCQPDSVVYYDGSDKSYQHALAIAQEEGLLKPIRRPNSFYAHTSKDDVARVEEVTFICSQNEHDAGPTNHWKDPKEAKKELHDLFQGAMQGRTLWVIPYCLGPIDSPHARIGVELTDSVYVVCNMHLMTITGKAVLKRIEKGDSWVMGVHSVGCPIEEDTTPPTWPCNKTKRIMHFPELKEIWSFGSGYGGNALLAKKCFGLRIASVMAKEEGWLAEHMLIVGVTSPAGKKRYIAAAFPSACGKTNFALMTPNLPGWKVECVGDDIAWLFLAEDGTLRAINPEQGFFGIAPGLSDKTNPIAIRMLEKDTLFTNVALTKDDDVWWEGLTKTAPDGLIDWMGNVWNGEKTASHPNARFTVSKHRCETLDEQADNPDGVVIDALIFGGRRPHFGPLVQEANTWRQGVLWGAMLASERTAAATGDVGTLQRDPFAMRPFCGYNMGQYFQHWLDMGAKNHKLPRIYSVNWFRKGQDDRFLWPGFGDNIRVIDWIFQRLDNQGNAKESQFGILPESLNTDGLGGGIAPELLVHDAQAIQKERTEFLEYSKQFGSDFPQELLRELDESCRTES